MTHRTITPDLPIAEAGRLMMAEELDIVYEHLPGLRGSAEVTAVHETRKAIRRTFTLFKLFSAFYLPGALEPHRRTLRRLMRRLAPCRDLAVFRQKLAGYNASADQPLISLANYWEERQAVADKRLRAYLERPKVHKGLKRYRSIATTPGAGLPSGNGKIIPLMVRHALPQLIFQRLGAVRAYGDILPEATTTQFHQLRIQFKELRYTLTYFQDVLGDTSGQTIDLTRRIQDHLGNLNDSSVAISLLIEMDSYPEEVAVYGDYQQTVLAQLTQEFYPLYAEFDRPEIRQALASAVTNL